jgi:hypothetical protein
MMARLAPLEAQQPGSSNNPIDITSDAFKTFPVYIGFTKDTIIPKVKLVTYREPNIIKHVSLVIKNHTPTEIHAIISKRISYGPNMIMSCLDHKGPMPAIWPLKKQKTKKHNTKEKKREKGKENPQKKLLNLLTSPHHRDYQNPYTLVS